MFNISDNKDAKKESLTDVRRAYRLIYLYQERLYSIIKHIRKDMNLEFYGWESSSKALGNSGTDITDRSVWNGIPLHNLYISLLPQSQGDRLLKGDWTLSLQFLADSGAVGGTDGDGYSFVNKDGEEIEGEARPEQFVCAEDSASVLWVYLYLMKSDQEDSVTWDVVWEVDEDVDELGKAKEMEEYGGVIIYAQEINLTDLQDDDSLNSALEKFKEEAREELDLEENFFTSK